MRQVLRWTQKKEKTRDTTQAVAGMNSQIRISESSDSEQHDEPDREVRRVTHRPGKPGKKQTPEEAAAVAFVSISQTFGLDESVHFLTKRAMSSSQSWTGVKP